MDKKRKALLALICCALLWSSGGILIKSVHLFPLAISGFRSLFALIFTLIVRGRPRWIRQPAFYGAILSYACTLTLFTAATCLTTAANAILIQYTAPVFVCFFSWLFYHEKPRLLDVGAIALVLGGMALFFLDSLTTNTSAPMPALGNVLALLSGVTFGLMTVLMRQTRLRDHSPESALVWGNMVCVLAALPFMFQKVPSSSDMLFLVLLGTGQIGLSYVLYTYALSHMTSLEMILIPIVEPLLNPVWVFIFRKEVPGLTAIIGGFIVLAVITGWCVIREKQRRLLPQGAGSEAGPGGIGDAGPSGQEGIS